MIDGTLHLLKTSKEWSTSKPLAKSLRPLDSQLLYSPKHINVQRQRPPGLPAYASFVNKLRLKHQAFIAIIADYNGQIGVQAQPKVVFLRILGDWLLPRIAPDADFLLLFGGIGRAWWRRIQCQSEAS